MGVSDLTSGVVNWRTWFQRSNICQIAHFGRFFSWNGGFWKAPGSPLIKDQTRVPLEYFGGSLFELRLEALLYTVYIYQRGRQTTYRPTDYIAYCKLSLSVRTISPYKPVLLSQYTIHQNVNVLRPSRRDRGVARPLSV